MTPIYHKSSLSDRAAIIITGNLINAGLGIIGGLVLVRVLPKYAFGTYSQAFLLFSTFSSLFLIGLPESLYYFIPIYSSGRRKALILQTYVIVLIMGSLLGGLLAFGGSFAGTLFGNSDLGLVLIPFSFFVVFSLPVMLFRPILISLDQHRSAAFGGILVDMSVLATIAITGLLKFNLTGIFQAIAVVAAFRLVGMVGFIAWLLRGSRLEWHRDIIKEQIGYSGPLALANLIGLFTGRVDSFVISMTYPPEKYAAYSVGAREVPLVDSITYSVGSVTLPHLVAHYKEGRYKEFIGLWFESTRKVALIMLPLFMFLIVYARLFVVLLFTANYSDSVAPFVVFLFLLPLRVTAYGNILRAMGLTKPLIGGAIITGVLTLILNLILIRVLGLIGPAIATVLVAYSLAAYYLWQAKSQLKISFFEIMPWDILFKGGFVAGLAVIPALAPLYLFSSPWLQLACGLAVYGVSYPALAWFTGVIRSDDVTLVRRWLNPRTILGL